MDTPVRVLILEDNASDAELMKRELRKAGLDCAAECVQDKEAFLGALDRFVPDVILADYALPGFDGLGALALARRRSPEIPVIIVSGRIGEEAAIDTLKAGATDYVLKQRLSRLGPVVQRALQEAKHRAEKRRAEQALREQQEALRASQALLRVPGEYARSGIRQGQTKPHSHVQSGAGKGCRKTGCRDYRQDRRRVL